MISRKREDRDAPRRVSRLRIALLTVGVLWGTSLSVVLALLAGWALPSASLRITAVPDTVLLSGAVGFSLITLVAIAALAATAVCAAKEL